MPLAAAVIASSVIGAGTAIYAGSQQKSAAKDALNAQTAANDKSLAAQQAARDQVAQLQQPFQQGGELGMAALLERLGLTHNGTPTGQSAPTRDPYYGYQSMTGGPAAPAPAPAPIVAPGASTGMAKTPGGNAGTSPLETKGTHDPIAPAQGAPDWKAYLAANPDVADWAQQHGDPNIPLEQQTPEQRAAYQWAHEQQAYGSDPRALTYLPGETANDPGTQQGPQDPQAPDLMNAPRPVMTQPDIAARPDAPAIQNYTRPDQGTAPDFGQAPQQSQFFDPSQFHTDPGYQFALAQGQRNLNANFGARGLLKSGAAMQGAIDYGQGMADQQYGNWFNRQNSLYGQAVGQFNNDRSYGTNLFMANRTNANQNYENDRGYGTNLALNQRDFANTNYNNSRDFANSNFINARDFANNNFTNDRQYQTGRYDTATGNLFDLTNIGQRAAGAVGGADQAYANNAGNIFGAQANAASTAAASRAQANASMVGSIGGAAANLVNTLPGSFSSGGSGGYTSNLGTVNYGSALQPGNVFAARTF